MGYNTFVASYRISQLKPDQVDAFFTLYEQIVWSDFKEWTKESKERWIKEDYSPDFWKNLVQEGKCPVFVAYEGEKMIGYVAIETLNFGVAYLGWVGILKDHRGKGLAREIVSASEEWGKRTGVHKIELETQVIDLLPFFLKLGFTLEGVRHNSWQGLDNYMFGKEI